MTHRLILDVSSMMYRAYFAMGDTVHAPDGRTMGALHGYLDMVARLVKTRRPDEVVHAYDHDWRPVARTDLYPPYKATRAVDRIRERFGDQAVGPASLAGGDGLRLKRPGDTQWGPDALR